MFDAVRFLTEPDGGSFDMHRLKTTWAFLSLLGVRKPQGVKEQRDVALHMLGHFRIGLRTLISQAALHNSVTPLLREEVNQLVNGLMTLDMLRFEVLPIPRSE